MKTIYEKMLFLLFLFPVGLWAQSTVNGTVTDRTSGQSLPGVSVIIQGSTSGTSTDLDGNFSLPNVRQGDIISFSYLGFETHLVTYQNQQQLLVQLEEDSEMIDEVVIVGYGTVRRQDATGSITTVTSKDFVKGPVVAADQMIQGKVAGVQVTSGGGAPGEGAMIRIRQGSSLSANNDPLIVIDGIPVGADNTGGRNPLATINQNDIESVTILKDASATAIYGSRASNGVVIITTKKGRSGEMQVSYSGNVSYSETADRVSVLSGDQLRDYVNMYGSPEQQALLGTANTDWQKEIYRTALGTDHNIALSGGAENLLYRVSVGLTDMQGILKKDNFNRTTIGVNLSGDFFDNHLKIELNNKSSIVKNKYAERGAVGAALAFDPTQNIRNADGTFFEWNQQLASRNPVAMLEQSNHFGSHFRYIGNVQADYKFHFFPDLKVVANLGYDYTSGQSYGGFDPDYGYSDVALEYQDRNDSKNRLMDLYLNYRKDIGAFDGSVELTAGYNYQNFDYIYHGGYNIAFGGEEFTRPAVRTGYNLQSYFARGIFNFYDKYILTATVRRDGTSRFASDYRWANFPSLALAWKVNEESFLRDVNAVSDLKVRLGWGITGQQDIGTLYPSLPTYLSSDPQAQYQLGNEYFTTVRPEAYNPNLKWEETETRNIGLDFGFFENRLTGSVDVYEKRTKDLLAYIPNPPFYGFSNYDNYNVGKMKNQGIEIAAEVVALRNDDWNIAIGGNITFQNSEITGLIDGAPNFGMPVGEETSGGISNQVQFVQVGYTPYAFYVYEQAYDTDGNPIDGVFVDRNGDGVIGEDDRYFFKKPQADVFYGFYANVSYKNWDFSTSWRGSWGNYLYNDVSSNLGWSNQVLIRNTDLGNASTDLLDTNFNYAGTERYLSDYYIQDASFIRMDNVTVAYTFRNFLGTNADARLSLAGQNLILITNYKGLDPEINNGLDKTIYPRPRMYTLGLNVTF